MITTIVIKAAEIHDNGNGTFAIRLEGGDLSNEDRQILERLFPNLTDAAYDLLSKEALLNALATPAEANAPPTNEVPPEYISPAKAVKPKKKYASPSFDEPPQKPY